MKKFFHKGYFCEMFRQLKVIGIVAAAILMVTNISTALTTFTGAFVRVSILNSIPGGIQMAWPMMVYVYLAGLVFTFIGFNWLNRRSYSDFYHALPVTRKQIYFSTFAAIMLWMVIGLTAYAIVQVLIRFFFNSPFNYLLFFCVYINMLIGALEVVGAVSLACAISGTRFVNFFAAIVIMFMPRFLLTVMSLFIENVTTTVLLKNITSISLFFDPSYNILGAPYASLLQSISGQAVNLDFAKLPAMLWTLGYSIILVVLGAIAFNKRSSETAGIPTQSKLFQGVVRTAVGLPLLLILMFLIADGDAALVPSVILVIFSFIFYCLYELISTKSPKKMAKSMPLWFICVGISLLYLVVPKLIVNAEENVRVSKENIKGFYWLSDTDSFGLYDLLGYGGDKTYNEIKLEKVELTDPESIETVFVAYQRTKNWAYQSSMGNYNQITVKLDRTNGRDIIRNIYLTESEYTKLVRLADENAEYARLSVEFPKAPRYFAVDGLTVKEATELGKLFEEEYNTLDDAQKNLLMSSAYSSYTGAWLDPDGGYSAQLATLQVCGCVGARNYSEVFYLRNSITPRTLSRYIEMINEKNGEEGRAMLDELKVWFENGGELDRDDFTISAGENVNLNKYDSFYWNKAYEEGQTSVKVKDTDPEYYEIVKILANASLTSDPMSASRVTVFVSWYKDTNDFSFDSSTKAIYLRLTDEELSRIEELYREHLNRMYYNNVPEEIVY